MQRDELALQEARQDLVVTPNDVEARFLGGTPPEGAGAKGAGYDAAVKIVKGQEDGSAHRSFQAGEIIGVPKTGRGGGQEAKPAGEVMLHDVVSNVGEDESPSADRFDGADAAREESGSGSQAIKQHERIVGASDTVEDGPEESGVAAKAISDVDDKKMAAKGGAASKPKTLTFSSDEEDSTTVPGQRPAWLDAGGGSSSAAPHFSQPRANAAFVSALNEGLSEDDDEEFAAALRRR